jgi:hypothetical protein
MSAAHWAGWLVVAGSLIVAGIYRIRKYGRAEGGEVTPLDDLLGPVRGPEVSDADLRARVLGEPCTDPDCANCAAPLPGEDDADAAFDSVMRILNGEEADEAMDPIVERIVAIVQNAVVEAEAVELEECEAEFLADPMHFGRAES